MPAFSLRQNCAGRGWLDRRPAVAHAGFGLLLLVVYFERASRILMWEVGAFKVFFSQAPAKLAL